jgi:hypothetical protein
MGKRFWIKENIFGLAGILAYAVTTLVLFIPFKGEPSMSLINWHSPLGYLVIGLFVLSVVFYAIGIFKRDKKLSHNDEDVILKKRQQFLPKLSSAIDNRIKTARVLQTKAERFPLSQYWDKYLRYTFPYIITKYKPKKDLEITNALAGSITTPKNRLKIELSFRRVLTFNEGEVRASIFL